MDRVPAPLWGTGKGPSGNAVCWKPTIRILRERHGEEPASRLGPATLRQLIESEAKKQGWSLTYSRDCLARVKTIYKWAKNEELIAAEAYDRLRDVQLRDGSFFKATTPLPPVEDTLVERTLPHLKAVVAAMVQVQRLVGAGPAEMVSMRPQDIDRSGEVWVYTPEHHETEHRKKSRHIYLGAKAQALIAPWLLKADKWVWSWGKGRRYSTDSYRRAVQRMCARHGIPMWSPVQLRKRCATDIRAALDVEAAAAVLGHSSSIVTQDHYAAQSRERAVAAVRKLG